MLASLRRSRRSLLTEVAAASLNFNFNQRSTSNLAAAISSLEFDPYAWSLEIHPGSASSTAEVVPAPNGDDGGDGGDEEAEEAEEAEAEEAEEAEEEEEKEEEEEEE